VNGSFDDVNPTFLCYYNQTGTFYVRLYLQDSFNTDDHSAYNTQTIFFNVINGVPGSTCNLISIPPADLNTTPSSASSSEINNAGTAFFDDLTGGNTDSKLLIAMALIVGIIAMTYSGTKNTMISIIAGIVTMVCSMAFGLFPIWIFILILVAMMLIIILVWVVMKPVSEG
jgi:hypothetical protein